MFLEPYNNMQQHLTTFFNAGLDVGPRPHGDENCVYGKMCLRICALYRDTKEVLEYIRGVLVWTVVEH